jgi:hypothetical protein
MYSLVHGLDIFLSDRMKWQGIHHFDVTGDAD